MRAIGVVLLAMVALGGVRAEAGQPYGCWAIRDAVERLACFDMALGPPVVDPPLRERPEATAPAAKAPQLGPPAWITTPD